MQDSLRDSLRERLAGLTRREVAGLIALAAILAGGAGLWYVRSLPRPIQIRSSFSGGGPPPAPSATTSPAVLLVHVAGWVRHPGVYRFADGDRVIDAVEVAGGAKKGANLDALNLAAPLTDGEQVLVPRPGSFGGGGPVGGGGTASPATKVDINTASADQLEALPGIGPVLAQKIIDYRQAHGPFPTVDALLDVSGIGPAILDEIRDLVTV